MLENLIGNTKSLFDFFFKDDGGGMDPESLRKCMSLGYSTKKANKTIGQCNCFDHIYFSFFCFLQFFLFLNSGLLEF